MGQLLKVTTTPLEVVRFSEKARLIPSNMVDVERRKVLARHNAFQARLSTGATSTDLNYVNRVNKAFSVKHHAAAAVPKSEGESAVSGTSPRLSKQAVSSAPAQLSFESTSVSTPVQPEMSGDASAQTSSDAQSQAAYTAQRGAFELRVAKGELSYVPAMVMTIVTQYPQVNFEYIGGFNYVPPDWNEPVGSNVNITI